MTIEPILPAGGDSAANSVKQESKGKKGKVFDVTLLKMMARYASTARELKVPFAREVTVGGKFGNGIRALGEPVPGGIGLIVAVEPGTKNVQSAFLMMSATDSAMAAKLFKLFIGNISAAVVSVGQKLPEESVREMFRTLGLFPLDLSIPGRRAWENNTIKVSFEADPKDAVLSFSIFPR